MSFTRTGIMPNLDECYCADITSTAFKGVQKFICPKHLRQREAYNLKRKLKRHKLAEIARQKKAHKSHRAMLAMGVLASGRQKTA